MTVTLKRSKPPRIFLTAADHDRLDQILGDVERTGPGALLRAELDRATIGGRNAETAVGLYRWIHYTDGATREPRRIQLVPPNEADIDQGRVSVLSYVGAGLLGLREGDGIDWPDASGKERRLTLVQNEPSDAV